MQHLISKTGLCASIFLIACSGDPTDSVSADLTQKPKGALALAPKLGFGQTVLRSLENDELNLYDIKLKSGDKIRIEKRVKSGTLAPNFTLYFDGTTTVKASSYERQATLLSKNYTSKVTGHYIVAVRGYEKVGAGKYELTITCIGGPCSGAPSKPIGKSVSDLMSLFEFGNHDAFPVSSFEPLAMVEEYISQDHEGAEESFTYVSKATKIESGSMTAGTLTTAAARAAVLDGIDWTYTNLGLSEMIPARQQEAAAILDDLADAGATFGFDGFEQSFCATPTTQLLVIDATGSRVHGVDLNPCSD